VDVGNTIYNKKMRVVEDFKNLVASA
jgi:hypothetical protein